MNIILIGFKSAGKTSIGQALAKRLDLSFIDTDEMLKHQNKVNDLKTMYQDLGESEFRALEHAVIKSLSSVQNAVIATGGGSILNADNRELLKSMGVCIFIDPPLDLIEQRLQGVATPVFDGTSIAEMHQFRRPLYQELSDLICSVLAGQSVDCVVESIQEALSKHSF